MGKGRKKVSKSGWKEKGPFAALTFGEILSVIMTGFIIALAMLFFQSLVLTPYIILVLLILCFIGVLVAKGIIGIANYKIRKR